MTKTLFISKEKPYGTVLFQGQEIKCKVLEGEEEEKFWAAVLDGEEEENFWANFVTENKEQKIQNFQSHNRTLLNNYNASFFYIYDFITTVDF